MNVQLVIRDAGYRRYPTAPTAVALRYEDLPSVVELDCPTRDGATAMKLAAWADRAAPRDLCDLFGLARIGAITTDALELAASAAWPIQAHHFDDARMPSQQVWRTALGHQMRQPPDRHVTFAEVRTTVAHPGKRAGLPSLPYSFPPDSAETRRSAR
ncbi:MAG: nucleotidyl transferase AbiEii/AbiGii toxin family protein [Egibacteraceae bacterium]